MKIAAVSMVKDECDIIELFVRINARVIDHFYIVDNGSSDSTLKILELMTADGLPITLTRDESIGYPQDKITTMLIRRVASLGVYDWIFPLDADEFIHAPKSHVIAALGKVPQGYCGLLNWATFIPVSNENCSSNAPLWNGFRQRASEGRSYGKVIIPADLARVGSVAMGNHSFRIKNKTVVSQLLDIPLAHVPVRSSEQLITKAIVGSHKFSIKENRRRGEGVHWDRIAGQVREAGYVLCSLQLKDIALSYALEEGDVVNKDVLLDSRLGTPGDCMVYPELASISVAARFDSFMLALCREIKGCQHRRRKFFFRLF